MKSSFCEAGNCVDVDTMQIEGEHLVQVSKGDVKHFSSIFTQDEWEDFIKGVKAGEFDWRVLFPAS